MVPTNKSSNDPRIAGLTVHASGVFLFLTSFCVLVFEVSLSRICSVLLQYHMSFAVVSLTILGIGAGGFAAYTATRKKHSATDVATTALTLFSPALLAALATLLWLPFARFWPFLIFLLLPAFVATGAFQALVLRSFPQRAGILYGADLCGGALGALASVPAMNILGGPVNTAVAIALLGALTALGWSLIRSPGVPVGQLAPARTRKVTVFLALLAASSLAAQLSHPLFDVNYERTPEKLIHRLTRPITLRPNGAPPRTVVPRIVPELTRWDAYSRVDVVELNHPPLVQRRVFIDGETPTAMLPAGTKFGRGSNVLVHESLAAFPYRLLRPQSVLAIGSGGGYDVVVAKRFDAQRIDAVELNRSVLEVTDEARAFTGDVYRLPGVRLVHAEGRQFVRAAEPSTYDLVVLALAQSLAGNLQEFALAENYLYTEEAFDDYFRVLRPGGAVAILVDQPVYLKRLLSTAFAALEQHGFTPTGHVIALGSPKERPYNHLLVVRNTPYAELERQVMSRDARGRRYALFHLPTVDRSEAPQLTARELLNERAFDLSPATDDRPFFFHVSRSSPGGLVLLIGIASILVVAAWLVTPRAALITADSSPHRHAAFFGLLGLAFIAAEILVLQKTVLIVGFPTINLAVVLAVFLFAAGLGSACSPVIVGGSRRRLRALLLFLAAALTSIPFLLDSLHGALQGASLVSRCVVLSATLSPYAFVMGMPFPSAIRLLSGSQRHLVPWLWGINGAASILGSGIAVYVALQLGFRLTALLPAALYTLAGILSAPTPGNDSA